MAATTVIAAGSVVRGHLTGQEDLLLQGRVEGSVALQGNLDIEVDARADATIEAVTVRIQGTVVGRVVAREGIELSASARVRADLVAPRLVIAEGALFAGAIDMSGAPVARPVFTAPAPMQPVATASPTGQPSLAPVGQPSLAPVGQPSLALGDDDDDPALPDGVDAKNIAFKKKK
jgi:cytoskeletal protein CcmA (bactofilin family)